MSRDELVAAYGKGAVSRRAFIRGLVASGVSLSAATAYSVALRPSEAAAQSGRSLRPSEPVLGDYYAVDRRIRGVHDRRIRRGRRSNQGQNDRSIRGRS